MRPCTTLPARGNTASTTRSARKFLRHVERFPGLRKKHGKPAFSPLKGYRVGPGHLHTQSFAVQPSVV